MPRRPLPTLAAGLLAALAGLAPAACADPVVGPKPQAVADTYVPRPDGIRLESWVEDLEVPWSLVFLSADRALVSERPGRIRLIRDGTLDDEPWAVLRSRPGGILETGVELVARGEGGLMGLAVHPDFPDPPHVYAMHTYRDGGGVHNRVIRLVDAGTKGRFERVVLDGLPGGRFHDGGRIAFGPDGLLYVTVGETFEAELADDRDSLGGKILRVAPDGSVPQDNPFPGSPVYSYGHRNPQGLAWHPATGELFASEHGPSGEFGLHAHDEINVIRAGADYGWPNVVGAPGRAPYVDPLVAWKEAAVPPAGMAFWRGDLFVAMLGSGALIRIGLERADGGHRVTRVARWFARGPHTAVLGRIRGVRVGPDGRLYFTTSNRDGRGSPAPGDDRIYRLAGGD